MFYETFVYDRSSARYKTDDKGVTLTLEVPGASPEDVSLEVLSDAHLKVKAKTLRGQLDERFSLGRDLDAEQATATVKNGVLTVVIPFRKERGARKIEVRAG